ncbi:MAG: hypothetical protein HOP19_01145 [Acidobacteria bacterium]|nr:hypothetical protein [Acidobacteriota bacterium]
MRKLIFLIIVGCAAVAAAHGQTAAERKALTAADFTAGRRATANENAFRLQINPSRSPVHLRLSVARGLGHIEITADHAASSQTLSLRTSLDAASFTQLFTVMDANFDGYLDLAAVAEAGAKWGRLNFWLYDPRTQRYVTSPLTRELARLTHNGIEANVATQELVVSQFPQATPRAGTLSETYKIANGHLLLVKRELIQSTREGLKAVTQQRIGGKLKVVSAQKLP